jgi:hypothetical protein
MGVVVRDRTRTNDTYITRERGFIVPSDIDKGTRSNDVNFAERFDQ